MNTFIRLAMVLAVLLLGTACERAPQATRDIRAPLKGGFIVTKDLTKETQVPSTELNQTIEAVAQNKDVMIKVVVKKDSPIAAEVERQVSARNLQSRVQLVEQ